MPWPWPGQRWLRPSSARPLAGSARRGRRRADRKADRAQARTLFSQITPAITALEAQQADFRQRRDGVRANGLATGMVLVEAIGVHISGESWIRALPSSMPWIRQWDADESALFADRIQAITAQVNPVLVSLSLLSPHLQDPCAALADALAAALTARGRADITSARDNPNRTVRELHAAVITFTSPPERWSRIRRRRSRRVSGRPGQRSAIEPRTLATGRGAMHTNWAVPAGQQLTSRQRCLRPGVFPAK